MGRPRTTPAHDLGIFVHVCDHISGKYSLAELARAINFAPQSVEDALDRLESHYECRLVEKPPDVRTLRLTPNGEVLLERVRHCLDPIREGGTQIRILLAHSLTHNRELMSYVERNSKIFPSLDVSERREDEKDPIHLDISTGMDLDDDRERANLLSGELDLLLCWAVEQRKRRWHKASGLVFAELAAEYPLALVSSTPKALQKCIADDPEIGLDFDEIIKHKCAVLDHDKQPLDECLVEHGLYSFGSHRVVARSFAACVELIRGRVATLAIVPLIRQEFDNLQALGELFYRELPARIKVGALHRKIFPDTGSPNTETIRKELNKRTATVELFIKNLDRQLEGFRERVPSQVKLGELPEDGAFVQKLRYGYYLFEPDEKLKRHFRSRDIRWCYEDLFGLRLGKSESTNATEDAPFGRIVNQIEQEYRVQTAELVDGTLRIDAREATERAIKQPPSAFLSIFTAAVTGGVVADGCPPTIIVGTWFGGGGRDSAINTWTTIFSSVELEWHVLNAISREAAMRHTLSAPGALGREEVFEKGSGL